jgi:hypothetical protein
VSATNPLEFRATAGIVSPAVTLRSTPDTWVQIGYAEDGLPLILRVERSWDVGTLLATIADVLTGPNVPRSDAMFKTFQQSIEQYSGQAWAAERVFDVAGRDGCTRKMCTSPPRR